jgi:hypothetical protein
MNMAVEGRYRQLRSIAGLSARETATDDDNGADGGDAAERYDGTLILNAITMQVVAVGIEPGLGALD